MKQNWKIFSKSLILHETETATENLWILLRRLLIAEDDNSSNQLQSANFFKSLGEIDYSDFTNDENRVI